MTLCGLQPFWAAGESEKGREYAEMTDTEVRRFVTKLYKPAATGKKIAQLRTAGLWLFVEWRDVNSTPYASTE